MCHILYKNDFWSGPLNFTNTLVDTWERAEHIKIHLTAGKYMFGIKANVFCMNDIFISVKADNLDQNLELYEKDIIIPVTGYINVETERNVSIACQLPIFKETDLFMYIYSSRLNITIKCEVWAKQLCAF